MHYFLLICHFLKFQEVSRIGFPERLRATASVGQYDRMSGMRTFRGNDKFSYEIDREIYSDKRMMMPFLRARV